MGNKKFWVAILSGGIAVNLLDIVVRGGFLKEIFITHATEVRTDIDPFWFFLFGFLKIVIFVWFFFKVKESFGSGARGGVKFGLYYGIALNVPAMFFPYLVYRGVPYMYIWITIAYGIVWAMLLGLIVGRISDRPHGNNPVGTHEQ